MGSWNEVSSHQTLKKDEFYALLSVADLAVITPLRDGMNTTSMEFVIAQEKTNKSPCVLSEFMGISKTMEHTLLVNPWNLGVSILPRSISVLSWFDWSVHPTVQMDVWHGMINWQLSRLLVSCFCVGLHQEVAAAINQGLLMSPSEKAARHAKLYKVVTTYTSHSWASILVKRLLGQLRRQGMARQTPYILKQQLEQLYTSAKKRLFLFDYDVSSLQIQSIYLSYDTLWCWSLDGWF